MFQRHRGEIPTTPAPTGSPQKKTGKEGIQANSLPMTKSKQIQLKG